MKRRSFLLTAGLTGVPAMTGFVTVAAQPSELETAPAGPAAMGIPEVSGPAPDSLAILQALRRPATGYLEFSVDGGDPTNRI